MGCQPSKPEGQPTPRRPSIKALPLSKQADKLRLRINFMLKGKQLEFSKLPPVTFSKILMKSDTLHKVLERIRKVYTSLDINNDGKLDYAELQTMIDRLKIGDDVTPADLKNVIELCDLDHDESISLKEFIVTLALLYLLKAVPSLRSVRHGEPRTSDEPSPSTPDHNRRHSVDKLSLAALAADGESPHALDYSVGDDEGAFLNCSNDIHYLVHWVVAAYLLFDKDCTGQITKQTVVRMRDTHDANDIYFLNEDRWTELDWDGNGAISFAEFVYAFSTWIKDFRAAEEEE